MKIFFRSCFLSPTSFYLTMVKCRRFYCTWSHWHSVGLFWTSDRSVAEVSAYNTQHLQETNIHAFGGNRTRNPSKRAATGLRITLRAHWDRYNKNILIITEKHYKKFNSQPRLFQHTVTTLISTATHVYTNSSYFTCFHVLSRFIQRNG